MTDLHPTPDDELFDRIASGDTDAFQQLFHRYFQSLCNFAAWQVDSADTAADIVQDVFFTLWQHQQRLRLTSTPRAYLFGAIRKGVLHWQRHHQVVQRLTRVHWPEGDIPGAGQIQAAADSALELQEAIATLERALSALPERTQLALRLRWERQLSYAEVAAVMDISVKGVEKLRRTASALFDTPSTRDRPGLPKQGNASVEVGVSMSRATCLYERPHVRALPGR